MQAVFENLMAATIANDRECFLTNCSERMKAALTAEKLKAANRQIAPRASTGYTSEYLGDLRKRDLAVHLWRLRFNDGGDDVLIRMSLRDEKVAGFFLG